MLYFGGDYDYTRKNYKCCDSGVLNSGYLGASLRKIAKAAHVTTGAMYGYYKNKEALFNDIVEEVSEEFKNDYLVEGINLETIDYIYQNFEVFKLIICCSKGTRYEEYLDCLVNEKRGNLMNMVLMINYHILLIIHIYLVFLKLSVIK